jgi:hypothetical protein
VFADAARRLLETGRLDDAAEALMAGYEREKVARARGRRRRSAAAAAQSG